MFITTFKPIFLVLYVTFCETSALWRIFHLDFFFAHRLTCGFLLLCLKGKFALNGERTLHATQVQARSYTSLETGNAPASLLQPVDSFISTSRPEWDKLSPEIRWTADLNSSKSIKLLNFFLIDILHPKASAWYSGRKIKTNCPTCPPGRKG